MGTSTEEGATDAETEKAQVPDDIFDYFEKIDREDEEDDSLQTVSFEINPDHLEFVQKK